MNEEHQQPKEWILTQDDWNRLKEHLVIGCTNQQKFLDSLRPHPAPATEHKFTCWRGECKLHDDCIHSYGQEYPPCVDACAQQAARKAREDFIDEAITQCEWDGPITQEDVWRKLESLRSTQQQAGDQK